MLVSTALEWLQSQFNKDIFMLQSLVTSVTILAASVWIASNYFFDSDEQFRIIIFKQWLNKWDI